MKKNRFIRNTFILVLGGFFVKICSFAIKILYTRYLTSYGVSLVSLVFPTYALLITICTFSLPLAITKLVAKNKSRTSEILFNSFWITIFINICIFIFIFAFSDTIANHLLHEQKCSVLLKILSLSLPFISITSLIKAYFYGIENVKPIVISNISEEIIKICLVIIFLPNFVRVNVFTGVKFYLFTSLICEVISLFVLFMFLPKRIKIKNLRVKYNSRCTNQILSISVPTLSGKLIGNIGYFFEPIIYTNLLLFMGYSSSKIILNYGYYQGYALPLLTIPSFFLSALSSNLVPLISKYYENDKIKEIKKITFKMLSIIILLGIIYAFIIVLFGKSFMSVLYKNTNGYSYLLLMGIFFPLFYLESPLYSILQGIDEIKISFKISIIGLLIKYVSLIILILLNFGFKSIVYSEIIDIIVVVTLCIYYLKKKLLKT